MASKNMDPKNLAITYATFMKNGRRASSANK